MELKIKANSDFEKFIKKYESQVAVVSSEEISDSTEYNSKLSEYAGQFVISLAVSVFSPFITDYIKEYVESTNEEVVVTTDNEQYVINASNVKELLPMLHSDVVATLSEEDDGKNW